MTTLQQQEALQNFATKFGFKIEIYWTDDKRKKDKFFVSDKNTSISPILDYDACNHFLLGYLRAVEKLIGKSFI